MLFQEKRCLSKKHKIIHLLTKEDSIRFHLFNWHDKQCNLPSKVRKFFKIFFFWIAIYNLTLNSSVHFSHSVVSDSLWPHGLQHARPPCPSPSPGAYSNSCPSSQWCHPTISSSVVPFSSRLQFHGLYSPWGRKESDATEQLSLHFTICFARDENSWTVSNLDEFLLHDPAIPRTVMRDMKPCVHMKTCAGIHHAFI